MSSEKVAKKVVKNFNIVWGEILGDEFPQIFTVDSKPLKPSKFGWAELSGLCVGSPAMTNKIFIGWVTMSQRISAASASKVTKSRSTFRGHIVD